MSPRLLACVFVLAAGCTAAGSTSSPGEPAAAVPAAPSAGSGEVLGHVQLQRHKVTIRSGSGGLRYDIRTRGGKVIAASLSQAEFRAGYPALFDVFQDAYGMLDARLDDSAPSAPAAP
jgi:hypothetical protein